MGPDDLLVAYSDGIPEAQSADLTEFGDQRLIGTITQYKTKTAVDIQKAVINAVQGFVDDAPQFDDITLLVVQRSHGGANDR